ncbi:MAG TPA: hypothetical protein VHE35_34720 [Kofleriaceae bacterium]|nr:hypothetical protein [Kofleriaceae bacterium]
MVALVAVALGLSCDRRQEPIRFDPSVMAKAQERGAEVMARPDVTAAFSTFLDRLIAEPRLASAASKLMAELQADPVLSHGLTVFGDSLASSPAVTSVAAAMARAHPEWSPADLGTAFGQRVEANWARMPAARASELFLGVFSRAFDGPDAARFVGHFRERFGSALRGYVESDAVERRWTRRIIELGGGSRPSPSKAAELLVDHLWSLDRVAPILIAFFDDPEVVRACAAAAAGALELDHVRAAIVSAGKDVLDDPEVQRRVMAMMPVLLEEDPSPERVLTAVGDVMQTPAIGAAVDKVVAALLADRKVQDAGDQLLTDLGHQPKVHQLADQLLYDW